MRIFKVFVYGMAGAVVVVMLGIMSVWTAAMAGSQGDPNKPANSEAQSRTRDFGPIHILVGVAANESDGDTVNFQGVTQNTIVARDSGGTSVITPQIKPAQGSTVSATDWIPLTAITLSGTTSEVSAYPQINGNYMMRFVVTSCSSCVIDLWWSGQREN